MAWNEPGGGRNNNQDPWRGGNGDQGPPDLEEVMKKLQDRFGGIFGKRGGGGPSSGGEGNPIALFIVLLVAASLIWGLYGFYRVEEAEKAVVLRFGKYYKTTGPGLDWHMPMIDELLKVNTLQVGSHTHQSSMLTKDQNIVDVQLEVQYRVDDPKLFFLKVADPGTSLRQATESALRHVVGGTLMDQVITDGREVIAIDIRNRLQEYLNNYSTGLLIENVNIQDAHPPKQVKDAFDDVIKAKEDEVRLKNEAEAYANGIIPEARGMAKRQVEEALAYQGEVVARAQGEAERFNRLLTEYQKAPKVTRERLYIETMESVLSNSTKVMVDVDGGNNLLYLPLDKIMAESQSRSSMPMSVGSSAIPDTSGDRMRTRRDSGRSSSRREGR